MKTQIFAASREHTSGRLGREAAGGAAATWQATGGAGGGRWVWWAAAGGLWLAENGCGRLGRSMGGEGCDSEGGGGGALVVGRGWLGWAVGGLWVAVQGYMGG